MRVDTQRLEISRDIAFSRGCISTFINLYKPSSTFTTMKTLEILLQIVTIAVIIAGFRTAIHGFKLYRRQVK